MENKEDWKELEQWAENKKLENEEKFGLDIDNIDMQEKQKKMNKLAKVFKPITKTMKITFLLILLGVALVILVYVNVGLSNLKSRVNADVTSISILQIYGIKAEIISKEIDEHENGKYIFELKNNREIQFTAIKDWGKLYDDCTDNLQKYIFNSWNSDIKKEFGIKEMTDENGLINYENYIIVNDTKDVLVSTEYIIAFLEYAEEWSKENKVVNVYQQKDGQFVVPTYNIYIQIQEKKIYPYHAMYQTADEIRSEAQKLYNQ